MDDGDGDDFDECLERARDLLGASEDPVALAEAAAAVDRALAQRPDDVPAWLVKCQILSAQGDDIAALACAEMAVRRAPRLAEAHYWRAAILGDLGRYEDGLRALDRGFRNLGTEDLWMLEDLYYEKATMLDALGDRDGAVAAFEAGLERCPGSMILRAGLEPLTRARVRSTFKVLRGGLT
jgi:tetratricopeptide (TPR) repeat protein